MKKRIGAVVIGLLVVSSMVCATEIQPNIVFVLCDDLGRGVPVPDLPDGVEYIIGHDTTEFIEASLDETLETLIFTIALVI